MSYLGLPDRKSTTRWRRIGNRTLAVLDGARILVGAILILDAFRSMFTPDASILGLLLRWPGGAPLPAVDGLFLGAAFFFKHRASALVLAAHAVLALINIGEFYVLKANGLAAAAVPFSFITLGLLAAGIARIFADGPTGGWGWKVAGAIVSAPILLLGHLFSFGSTDYTRTADAIVVFGAKAYKDGTPSLALDDRVQHGIRLYHAGVAPVLVMSGGDNEPAVMKRLALEAGVPEAAIEVDPEGLNTYHTLRNVKVRRVVAVSHYYHLARIKLTAHRLGIRCATSPCRMTRRLLHEPWYVTRECAAFVGYYLFRG